MTQKNMRRKVRINWVGITWVLLVVLSVVFFFITINFAAFPPKYILPLGLILLLIDLILGFFSLRRKKRQPNKKKKSSRRIFVTIINCLLSIALASGSIYLPVLESKLKGVFVEPTAEQGIKMNVYVMTSAYKSEHSDEFSSTDTSTNLDDYQDAKFITQTKIDQYNQSDAISGIQEKLGVDSLNQLSTDSISDSVSALYDGTGDAMIMNEKFEESISELPGKENFSKDTQVLYTVVLKTTVDTVKSNNNYTQEPFMIYVAGSDTREPALEYYTRTDTNVLLTIDPVNKQILEVSVPRDWYVRNPALGNGYDKLTHLGNDGLKNTMDGLNQEFDFDYIKDYFEVNFFTFTNIIGALGGIDIYNPYTFSLDNGASLTDTPGEYGEAAGYVFEQGNLHLNDSQALSYVRERYNLPNGDYGRNEHQAIVLQAIIKKLTSRETIVKYNDILNSLQGMFLSSISSDDILSLAQMQLNDGGNWTFVVYHLGGTNGNDVTASMGNQLLYVSYPIDEQVEFVKGEITKVMNQEIITQEVMPGEEENTTTATADSSSN